jgi:hypothetical protein
MYGQLRENPVVILCSSIAADRPESPASALDVPPLRADTPVNRSRQGAIASQRCAFDYHFSGTTWQDPIHPSERARPLQKMASGEF